MEEENSWISEKIIYPRRSNNLHNTNADFKNYSREEVMKTTKLVFFLILFTFEYLKDILVPEMKNLLKYPMDLG